jgi:dTDP-4-dehydrorhamnose reductase
MKILIFGSNGMLGHKLYQRLGAAFDVCGTIRGTFDEIERFGIFDRGKIIENVDVTDETAVTNAIETARPDVVINAAGVIKQVADAKDRERTIAVNAIFPLRLEKLAKKCGLRLITIGTDCVFDGTRGNYTEKDVPDAHDLYGISKFLGEVGSTNCLTLRTSIIGRELGTAHSLVEWFLKNRGGRVKGFTRAIYTGLPTIEFADLIGKLITDHADLNGIYHVASEPITKYDLLQLLNKYYDVNVEIEPSDEVAIDRSLDGRKFTELTGIHLPDWPTMVAKMAADVG